MRAVTGQAIKAAHHWRSWCSEAPPVSGGTSPGPSSLPTSSVLEWRMDAALQHVQVSDS